jgi:phospholipid/cholesterol/gamma-HCH transport system substrate-binding protein
MLRTRLFGLGLVALLTGAVALSIAEYRQVFTTVDWVTLHTDHTGMQLNPGADVKLRGVTVGQVRDISADGERATLRLAIDPDQRERIPADVSARLLPKTLFGERYVELVPPDPATAVGAHVPLAAGDVIGQDRSDAALELEHVLDDALPLLQAIKPDQLATVLGTLAYALEERGGRTGEDLVRLDGYLAALNAQMPEIADNVRLLAEVADDYHDVAPDLIALLRDSTVTMTTVSEQRRALADFLAHTTGAADDTRVFLDRHGDQLIQLGEVSRPVLELLAVYAPQYPCLTAGIVTLQPQAEGVFATGRMHITLEATVDQGKYEPGRDEPVYGARLGPQCYGLPDPQVPFPGGAINDGYDHEGPRGPVPATTAMSTVDMGYAGTSTEQAVLRPLLAAAAGLPATDVSGADLLLWGPLMRGTVVNIS